MADEFFHSKWRRGTNAERLAYSTTNIRTPFLWYETDTGDIYYWNGSAWEWGNVYQAANKDFFPDGATDANHALNARLEGVSGDKSLGSYGYSPFQSIVPNIAWALGTLDGTARDDFFVDNYAGGNNMWTAVAGCTPSATNTNFTSLMYLLSGSGASGTPNHAILQATVSGHTANDYYWTRFIPAICRNQDHRIGWVLMQADLKVGAAIWYVFNVATLDFQIECATYNSVNAWLSQANAKTSNVGYTTDWTTRYTSVAIEPEGVRLQTLAIRLEAANTRFWNSPQDVTTAFMQLASAVAFAFTPAFAFLFVEGNLNFAKLGYFDWCGRLGTNPG